MLLPPCKEPDAGHCLAQLESNLYKMSLLSLDKDALPVMGHFTLNFLAEFTIIAPSECVLDAGVWAVGFQMSTSAASYPGANGQSLVSSSGAKSKPITTKLW